MAKNNAVTNTDQVTQTDRNALGRQPDGTPATGGSTSGGGGGGSPTGPAGGALSGTYPNPGIAAVIAAGGPIGDATHVAQVTYNAAGQLTAVTSVPIAFPSGSVGVPSSGPIYGRLRKSIAGAISSSSDMVWAAPDVYNVEDYGAAPFNIAAGATNDAAFAAAVAACLAAGGGTIYIPQTYYLTATITVSSATNLCFRGNGSAASHLVQNTANIGILSVTQGARDTVTQVKGLAFDPAAASTATCITVSNASAAANDLVSNFTAQDIVISAFGGNIARFPFDCGLNLKGLWNSHIYEFVFCGRPSTTNSAIRWENNAPSIAIGLYVIGGNIVGSAKCFDIRNDGTVNGIQGVQICDMNLIGVSYAVYSDGCIGLQVTNCDINANLGAIFGTGVNGQIDQAEISNNLIYSHLANSFGIAGGFVRSTMTGNTFIADIAAAGTKGIDLQSSQCIAISTNTFWRYKTTYITTDAGGRYNNVSGNTAMHVGTGAAANPYLNSGGATNSFVNNIFEP